DDSVNSTLNIEYHRIKIVSDYLGLTGEYARHLFGWSVGNVSDINEDGSFDDVIVGAPLYRSEPYNYTWGSNDTKVNQYIDSAHQYYPAIAIDSNDNSIICWQDERTSSNYDDIWAQKLDSYGTAQWSSDDVAVNQSTTQTYHYYPDVAVDSEGNAIFVWEDWRNGNYDVYAQKFDSSGNPQWGSNDKKVNNNSDSANQMRPAVVIDSEDNAIIVWDDNRESGDNNIYAQKLDSNGDALWGSSDKQVNQNSDTESQARPDVAICSDDTVVVVWYDGRSTPNYNIYAQKLNYTGSAMWGSSDVLVNQNSDSAIQLRPKVAVDSKGNAIVVWEDERNGATDEDIYAQKLNSGGNPQWGSEDMKVNQNSDSDAQYRPRVAVDSEGNSYIVWYDNRGSNDDIYAQKLCSDGIAQWGSSDQKINQNDTGSKQYPAVAVDSSGNVIVVWQDLRTTGNRDIYAQKFNATNVTGRTYIYHGGSSMDTTPDVNLTGENDGDKFGYSVHMAGDIDKDGAPDVIIGVPYWDNGATTDCGQILVFKGGSSMDTTADFVHNGTQANEHFGWSVGLACIMDGGNDNMVVVGGPHYDGSTDIGEAEILYIPEYSTLMAPFVGTVILFAVYSRKRRIKKGIRTEKS
ncbi:MAG: FG-GAP repeat protein, partial [Thermoplasmata archaeon]